MLIDHAHFDRLGIPRTLYEATPNEYLVTGGKFLLGIVPLALTGSLQFILSYWWLVLGTILLSALIWWKSYSSRVRWLIAAGCMALALVLLAYYFKNQRAPGLPEGVTMFIFVVVVGITYSYVEVSFLPDNKLAAHGMYSHLDQVRSACAFLCVLTLCSRRPSLSLGLLWARARIPACAIPSQRSSFLL